MKAGSILLLMLLLLSIRTMGQNAHSPDEVIQDLFRMQEDISYEEFYENLIQYINNPLDINRASREELGRLYILTPFQIENFILYREKTGGFISLYELQSVPGFDMVTVRHLLPFIRLEIPQHSVQFLTRFIHNKNQYLMTKFNRGNKDPDEKKSFLGDHNKISIRYRNYIHQDYSMGFMLKKDEGEPIRLDLSKKYYLMDYSSIHFSLYPKKNFQNHFSRRLQGTVWTRAGNGGRFQPGQRCRKHSCR